MKALQGYLGKRIPPLWVIAACIPAITFIYAFCTWPLSEYDLLWHIETGKILVETGSFQGNTDATYGPANSGWVTTQWLAEVVLYAAFWVGGDAGLGILRLAVITGFSLSMTFAVILASRVQGRSLPLVPVGAGFVLTLCGLGLVGIFGGALRPLTLTLFALPVAAYWALRALKVGRWPRWWTAGLLCLASVQFHGNAVVIPGLLAAAAVASFMAQRWSWAAVRAVARSAGPAIASSTLALFLTPLGPMYFLHARNISEAASPVISEWGPARLDAGLPTWPTFTLIAIWGVCLVASRRAPRVRAAELFIYVPVLIAPLLAYRFLPIALVVAAVFCAFHLGEALAFKRTLHWRAAPWPAFPSALFVFGVWVLAVVSSFPPALNASSTRGIETVPVIASSIDSLGSKRRVLVDYNLGGFLSVMTGAHVRVSQDGRSDRYGADTLLRLIDITEGKLGWQELLAESYPGTTDIVVNKSRSEHFLADGWVLRCEEVAPGQDPGLFTFVWLVREDLAGETPVCGGTSSLTQNTLPTKILGD